MFALKRRKLLDFFVLFSYGLLFLSRLPFGLKWATYFGKAGISLE